MGPALVIRLLGAIEINYESRPLNLPTRKANLLFAYLVLRRGGPVERVHLAGRLWPDLPEARARRNLNTEIWRIRQALGAAAEALEITPTTLAFAPPFPCTLDIDGLDPLRMDQPPDALQQIVAGYRGDFLSGYYDDWVLAAQERMRTNLLFLLNHLLEEARRRGETQAAVTHARRILELEPLSESTHRELIELYLDLDDRAAALRQYRQCAEILQRELSVAPLPETQDLYRRLVQTFPSGLPEVFVGREKYLAQMDAFLSGENQVFLVAGESGCGKSALVSAWARQAHTPPVITVTCSEPGESLSYAPIAGALQTIISKYGESILRNLPDSRRSELARLLPDASRESDRLPILPPTQARERLFTAVAAVIRQVGEGVVLFLDDLHHADADTLALLQFCLEILPPESFRLIGAYQPEMVALEPGHRLETWMAQSPRRMKRFLEPLTPGEVGKLVQELAGIEAPPEAFADRLFQESEGNPLFVMESLRDLFDLGTLVRTSSGGWGLDVRGLPESGRVPRGVEQLIRRRLDRMPGEALEILRLAAVLGSSFGYALLLEACDRREAAVLETLDLAVRASLVREIGAGMEFAFVHEKFRFVLLSDLSGNQLATMHGQAAAALEKLHAGREDEIVERLAFFHARSEHPERALPLLRDAARRAEDVYAYGDALRFLDEALSVMQKAGRTDLHQRFEIEVDRLRLSQLLGRVSDLVRLSSRAAELAEALGPRQQACVGIHLGRNLIAVGEWDAAGEALAQARARARRAGNPLLEAEALLLSAVLAYHTRSTGQRAVQLEDALRLAEDAGEEELVMAVRLEMAAYQGLPRLRADGLYAGYLEAKARGNFAVFNQFMTSLIINLIYDGRFGLALKTGDELLRLAEENGLESVKHGLLRALARCRIEIGDFSTARELARASLARSRKAGYRYGEMRALACLAAADAGLGDFDQAMPGFEHAMMISEDLGARQEWFLIAYFTVEAWLDHPHAAAQQSAEMLAVQVLQAATNEEHPRAKLLAHSQLARVCLAHGQVAGAETHAGAAEQLLEFHGHAIGREQQVFYVLAMVRQALGRDTWSAYLSKARGELARKSCSLPDKALRNAYLNNIPIHAEICRIRQRGLR